jgi:hypothetical protein
MREVCAPRVWYRYPARLPIMITLNVFTGAVWHTPITGREPVPIH